jgi:hypothetical protein
MNNGIASYVLQYAGNLLEAGLFLYLGWGRQWKKQRGALFYLLALLIAGAGRDYTAFQFGLGSRQYYYVYWGTDYLLVISAFLLVGLLFHRACWREEKMWRYIRLSLGFVFFLVVGISALSISRNQDNLFSYFTVEFSQNLYFTCLVLNTLLYLLLQQIESTDDQLGLLVCGVGIQFAGPTAMLALLHLTGGEHFAESLTTSVMRFCTLGMLLVWAYAIIYAGKKATQASPRRSPVLAEVAVD